MDGYADDCFLLVNKSYCAECALKTIITHSLSNITIYRPLHLFPVSLAESDSETLRKYNSVE
jgi:hypothetical protein